LGGQDVSLSQHRPNGPNRFKQNGSFYIWQCWLPPPPNDVFLKPPRELLSANGLLANSYLSSGNLALAMLVSLFHQLVGFGFLLLPLDGFVTGFIKSTSSYFYVLNWFFRMPIVGLLP